MINLARKISYTYEIRDELTRVFGKRKELLIAELTAMFEIGATLIDGHLEFSSSSSAVTRKVVALTKKIFNDAKIEVATVRRKNYFSKTRYVLRIFLTGLTEKFFNEYLSDDFAEKILRSPMLGVAYLRGAFLMSGSVNSPDKKNRLEIVFTAAKSAELAKNIFKVFDMNVGCYERTGHLVVYMKNGDSICEILGIIGAVKSAERFEVARNVKEVRAMANRLVNCDTANLNKAIAAAQRQIDNINILLSHKVELPEYLKETVKFRLTYPADNTGELAAKLNISKQGLIYRFKMIRKLAEECKSN